MTYGSEAGSLILTEKCARSPCHSDNAEANRASAASSFADRLGPVGNGGRGANRAANSSQAERSRSAPSKREKRKPITAADLDAELEAFMNTPSSKATAASEPAQTGPSGQDVEMS